MISKCCSTLQLVSRATSLCSDGKKLPRMTTTGASWTTTSLPRYNCSGYKLNSFLILQLPRFAATFTPQQSCLADALLWRSTCSLTTIYYTPSAYAFPRAYGEGRLSAPAGLEEGNVLFGSTYIIGRYGDWTNGVRIDRWADVSV
jgi:hypothetical protein